MKNKKTFLEELTDRFGTITQSYDKNTFQYSEPTTTATIIPTDYRIPVKFVNKSTNEDPSFGSELASGFDIRADLPSLLTIESGGRALIPTGLYFDLPSNVEIQVRPRSGLAAKYGVTVLNSPGTVDADYKGEVKVILVNHGKEPFNINHGDRIAQGVMAFTANAALRLQRVETIENDSARGSGGFGSTGHR